MMPTTGLARGRVLGGAALLLALTACTIETEQARIAGSTVRLTILRTSDMHSRLFPFDLKPNSHDEGDGLYGGTAPYGGLERIAGLLQRERQRGQRVVYLDSGDIFQGAPIFNYGQGEPEFRWLSLLGADAVALGNHEFDAGPVVLAEQAEAWISYPLLAANYVFKDWGVESNPQLGRSIQPFTIVNVKGLKLGIIGMGDIGSMYTIMDGANSAGITPLEANETVRAYVEFLHPAVDLIVVLSHLGLTEDQELTDGHSAYFRDDLDLSEFTARAQDPWVKMVCPECQPRTAKYWVPGVRGIDIILGGHLHILTRPPMELTDPAGRKVLLEHPGAFAKFMTRLDLMVAVPAEEYRCLQGRCAPEDNHFSFQTTCSQDADCARGKLAPYGAEIVAHEQALFPIDTIWCTEPRPPIYQEDGSLNPFFALEAQTLAAHCAQRGHGPTRNLLQSYRVGMEFDPQFILTQVFGYAPRGVDRKDTATGGDAPLGDLTTTAMMVRKRVEAEFCVTNTLGIRDNFYPGVVDLETVFNVFPFENTITMLYMSGYEIQEMFDFVTERSSGRGCQSQAQISGCSFVMNCGQVKLNDLAQACSQPADCCALRPELCAPDSRNPWACQIDGVTGQGRCYAHPAEDVRIGGQPLILAASYKMATNDYIGDGGSGFDMLRRNTTKVNTGIPMRDALIEHLAKFPTCRDLLNADPNMVDSFSLAFCLDHRTPEAQLEIVVKGQCTCRDVFEKNYARCASINPSVTRFCQNPLEYPILVARSDGRIQRKVK
jgi:2',3'-cyclic-nucleotide 2'-phosphodiesterase (5'-nucleotidase family)